MSATSTTIVVQIFYILIVLSFVLFLMWLFYQVQNDILESPSIVDLIIFLVILLIFSLLILKLKGALPLNLEYKIGPQVLSLYFQSLWLFISWIKMSCNWDTIFFVVFFLVWKSLMFDESSQFKNRFAFRSIITCLLFFLSIINHFLYFLPLFRVFFSIPLSLFS